MIRPERLTISLKTISTRLMDDGPIAYSEHPSTHLLYVAYHLPSWAPGRLGLWWPDGVIEGLPEPSGDDLSELFTALESEEPIWAENPWEANSLFGTLLSHRLDWPMLYPERWRTDHDVFKHNEHWVPLRKLTIPETALNLAHSLENRGIRLRELQDELIVSDPMEALTTTDIKLLVDYYRHLVAITKYTAKPPARVGNLTHGKRPTAE